MVKGGGWGGFREEVVIQQRANFDYGRAEEEEVDGKHCHMMV